MTAGSGDPMILAHLVVDRMASRPDLDVLTFVNIEPDGSFNDEIRTYSDLWRNGQRVAAALDEEGMQAGDAFGLITLNHPEFVDTMVGSSIAGTVFVPIDPRTRGKKLSYMLNHAQCRGAVIGDYALPYLLEVASECPRLEWIWVLSTSQGLATVDTSLRRRSVADILATEVTEMAIRVDDPETPMQMLYTSRGTAQTTHADALAKVIVGFTLPIDRLTQNLMITLTGRNAAGTVRVAYQIPVLVTNEQLESPNAYSVDQGSQSTMNNEDPDLDAEVVENGDAGAILQVIDSSSDAGVMTWNWMIHVLDELLLT